MPEIVSKTEKLGLLDNSDISELFEESKVPADKDMSQGKLLNDRKVAQASMDLKQSSDADKKQALALDEEEFKRLDAKITEGKATEEEVEQHRKQVP